MPDTEQLQRDSAELGELGQQSNVGAKIRWFVALWLLGVLTAMCAAEAVKLLMRGAVAI